MLAHADPALEVLKRDHGLADIVVGVHGHHSFPESLHCERSVAHRQGEKLNLDAEVPQVPGPGLSSLLLRRALPAGGVGAREEPDAGLELLRVRRQIEDRRARPEDVRQGHPPSVAIPLLEGLRRSGNLQLQLFYSLRARSLQLLQNTDAFETIRILLFANSIKSDTYLVLWCADYLSLQQRRRRRQRLGHQGPAAELERTKSVARRAVHQQQDRVPELLLAAGNGVLATFAIQALQERVPAEVACQVAGSGLSVVGGVKRHLVHLPPTKTRRPTRRQKQTRARVRTAMGVPPPGWS
mmetsp:Transcript_16441/g.57471  ORF Transcript_16441/g.57471 Transcript_16441/m.57471 type:complete len:297 (+) Transcript_16441:940-1830(+)